MAITGVHVLLYSSEAVALREMLRDVFDWKAVDAGQGWLIFALPPAELGVHPAEEPTFASGVRHQFTLMCDDITTTVRELRAKGVEVRGEPRQESYGITVTLVLPGGVDVMLYEPRHAVAITQPTGPAAQRRQLRAAMTEIESSRPDMSEYAADFGKYVLLPPDGDVRTFLAAQSNDVLQLLTGLAEDDSLVRHEPYTWSIKQVVGHLIDCERIFGYRALRIARNDVTPLASFDENDYMRSANFDRWPFRELLEEFRNLRRSHLLFFRHLETEAWLRRGVVLDQPMTVRALAYVIAGHVQHHLDILHRRLGK